MTDTLVDAPAVADEAEQGVMLGAGGAVLADDATERALLGAILAKHDLAHAAVAECAADDFFDPLHRRLFAVVADGVDKGFVPGMKSLVDALGGDPETKIVGGQTVSSYIAKLIADASAIDVVETARHIHDCAERRACETLPDLLPKEPFTSQFGAVWFHEVGREKPKRNWLVKNLILAKTFGIAFGPPGCGKSFLITDLALHCAAAPHMTQDARPIWFGYRGRPFGVVYVVAEGRDDFEVRLHAWRIERGIAADAVIPFVYLPTSIDMRSNEADTLKLAKEVNGLSEEMHEHCGCRVELVVVDTVARVLAGGNENASDVMGAFVGNCGKLQERTGVTVLGVHHGGKEAGRGPRGHEALHGSADFEFEVLPPQEGPNKWAIRKLKAGPAGASHSFRLRSVEVGRDNDGDAITSCVVLPIQKDEERDPPPDKKLKQNGYRPNNNEQIFLKCLFEAIDDFGVAPPRELRLHHSIRVVVDYDQVKSLVARRMLREEDNTDEGKKRHYERTKQMLKRAREGLTRYNVIGTDTPYIWHTGKPIQGFPRTQPREAPPPDPEPIDDLELY